MNKEQLRGWILKEMAKLDEKIDTDIPQELLREYIGKAELLWDLIDYVEYDDYQAKGMDTELMEEIENTYYSLYDMLED